MKLALVIPVLNHEIDTANCINSFKNTADNWNDIELLIIDNGSEVPVLEWSMINVTEEQVLRNEKNVGVLPALQQAYEATTADYIFYTHNDVTMYEQGWDTKIKRVIEGVSAGLEKGIGVAGFYGAKGIGTSDLYRTPYQMHQLVRVENVSNCNRMDKAHGYRGVRSGDWERVSVMDGFSLIISRKFLDENGGFDTNLPPHHMYDNHTCLQAMDLGYWNIVIAMDAFHHGGVTDVSEDWNTVFGKSKLDIHRDAHYPYFYEYWQPGKRNITLPIHVS